MTIRANANELVVKAKHVRLGEAHVAPLVELADAIAADRGLPRGAVPYPDPLCGGVHARVLLLMETPPVTSSARSGAARSRNASGLLSLENGDETAENTHLACDAAGLDPAHTVPWNLVPWPTGGRSLDHLGEATPWLGFLIDVLAELRVVVVFGDDARDGWLRALSESSDLPLVPTLWAPHPSRRGLMHDGKRERLHAVMRRAAEIAR